MEKWIVDNKPRMALFAGENGVETGEELTYDYNFKYVYSLLFPNILPANTLVFYIAGSLVLVNKYVVVVRRNVVAQWANAQMAASPPWK